MAFFKDLKNKVRNQVLSQAQPPMSPQMPPMRPPMSMPSGGPRRLPNPRFFGGGLGSIFSRLMRNNPKFQGIRRMPMPVGRGVPLAPPVMPSNMMAEPSLPMNFMPQDMPMERFPMERPGFAGGEGVDINKIIADQGARKSISAAEQRAAMIKKTAMEAGLNMTDATANAFGLGAMSFEEAMDRARGSNMDFMTADTIDEVVVTGKMPDRTSTMDRNLRQQEQIFFPEKEKSFRDFQRVFKGGRLGDFLSYIPDQMQVADYMNYKREQDAKMKAMVEDSLDDILEDLEKKN
jgi:hypothetical protein